MNPSERCAKAMQATFLATTQPEQLLADFIAEQTGCDELLAACEGVAFAYTGVVMVNKPAWLDRVEAAIAKERQ